MFKLITFLLSLATFFVTSNAQKDINCPRHFVPFNVSGKCYFVSDSLVSYPWAVELCEQLDAEVYVSNFYERNTIREFILKYLTFDYYWIGVHKVITNYSNNEGYWVYQNGSRVGHYYPWDYHYKIKPANEMVSVLPNSQSSFENPKDLKDLRWLATLAYTPTTCCEFQKKIPGKNC